ncbi:tartrate dehydrogenase [Salipiger profundus]|uniref:tartrate dehydrogenase n=1 Tax=Salipiger profundus TaxID=1229727 RepID=UPI0008E68498|nr:tartrate dehydrogenase [Salipiger profundus]SFD80540.1 tartrate dehydrogenase/decarboxylase / D-malate dehydrogenase [Salipiger profundus]
MKQYKIAAIGGDGIGPEMVAEGVRALQAIAERAGSFKIEVDWLDWGAERFKCSGRFIPEDGMAKLAGYDAILFGSAGAADVPDHETLWGLRLAICQTLDQYANLRPTRLLAGIRSPLAEVTPEALDWLIIRENSEGEYAGHGGRSHRGSHHETATEVSLFTRHAIERIMRYAFECAQDRPRRQLTVVTKSNAQRHGMVLWDEIAQEVACSFPDVRWDRMLVDAMTVRMVRDPGSLDTIVASNLHADILSDLAAALAGSIGIGPTANIDPSGRHPSMFEPIHGSAFDLVGKGVANPIGMFWSSVLLLDHLGEHRSAQILLGAIERVTADPANHTPDLGGTARTQDVTRALLAALSGDRS